MTSFTSPTGVKFEIVSDKGDTVPAEFGASMSEPSDEPNPVIVKGAFALLRTSLTSMLWVEPLRPQLMADRPPAAQKHQRRLR